MLARVKCPDCGAALNPSKPLPPGKKAKCPKCQAVFTVPGDDGELEEEAVAPRKQAAIKKAIKKGEPAKAAAPKPVAPAPKKPLTQDEKEEQESAGTYGFLDSGETEEQRQTKEPKIDYAPDLTVRDPRGAVVAILATPSTVVIVNGGLIALVGVALLMSGLWPFLFAEQVADPMIARNVSVTLDKRLRNEDRNQSLDGKPRKSPTKILKEQILAANDPDALGQIVDPLIKKAQASEDYVEPIPFEDFEQKDPVAYKIWELMEDRATTRCIWFIVLSFPILGYGITMGYGGVKMQTLESYRWGVASTIMGIIFGIGATGFAIYLLIGIDEDAGIMDYLKVLILIVVNVGGTAGSGWALRTMLDPKIKEAFEFDPEKDPKKKEDGEEEEEEEEDEEDDE